MPYLPTAQKFIEESTLLISARPTTARITTKYNIPHPSPPPHVTRPSSLKRKHEESASKGTDTQSNAKRSHEEKKKIVTLTVKCYDPVSGSCLKYRTDKQAEVGRLMLALGGCGRVMAGLPPQKEVEVKSEAAMEVDLPENTAPSAEKPGSKGKDPAKDVKVASQGQGQGGGGKKKKKGKK